MFLHVLRAMFILLLAAVAMRLISDEAANSIGIDLLRTNKPLVLIGCLLVAVTFIAVDMLVPRKSLTAISGVFFGLVVGMVISYGLSLIVDLVVESSFPSLRATPDLYVQAEPGSSASDRSSMDRPLAVASGRVDHPLVSALKLMIGVICCYLTISFILQTKDDVRFVIPYVEFARQSKGARPLILDTSVIIDGRIADIAETRIFESEMIVPRFVLQELQAVADSSDRLKRARGRRGLDILKRLQQSQIVDIRIMEAARGRDGGVDAALIELAAKIDGRLVTNDVNLCKVAELREVPVVNINDVTNALKPLFLPGETMEIKVVRTGEEPGQGVGYLEDGTMVVAAGASDRIGETIAITVTRVLQLPAGRMVFGRTDDAIDDRRRPPRPYRPPVGRNHETADYRPNES